MVKEGRERGVAGVGARVGVLLAEGTMSARQEATVKPFVKGG